MLKIQYGEVNETAKSAFDASLENCLSLSNTNNLLQSNVDFPYYVNPCDPYAAILDGKTKPIPDEVANTGIWGSAIAALDGTLAENSVITFDKISTAADVSSDGLTFRFDSNAEIYPTLMTVAWYLDGEKIIENEYEPQSVNYVVIQNIDAYDKIVVTVKRMSMPYARFKLQSMEHGFCVDISGDNIKNLQIHQEINPVSTTLPISTCNVVIFSKETADYVFEARQKLAVYDNEELVGVYFVTDAEQQARWQWSVTAHDYIGVLDEMTTIGVMAATELTAAALINGAMMTAWLDSGSQVPYTISDELGAVELKGFMPAQTTVRETLQQILFAAGGCAITAYQDGVQFTKLDSTVKSTIPLERIMSQSFSTTNEVTSVELTAHQYTETDEIETIYSVDADHTSGGYVTVYFDEPYRNITVYEGNLDNYTSTYATFALSYGGWVTGNPYNHETITEIASNGAAKKAVNNPVTIKEAWFVHPAIVNDVLESCSGYLFKTKTATSSIIEDSDSPTRVGETHTVKTEYKGDFTGVIISQDFNLYGGGKVVKRTAMRGVTVR